MPRLWISLPAHAGRHEERDGASDLRDPTSFSPARLGSFRAEDGALVRSYDACLP